jgi:hypothetical protein
LLQELQMSIPLLARRVDDWILIRAIQTSIQCVEFPVPARKSFFARSRAIGKAIELLKFLFFQQARDGGLVVDY